MDVRQAQTLQQHALDSLTELRAWLGSHEADASWGAQLDAALRAISKAFPECERRSSPPPAPVEPDVESVPPTLPSRGAGRAGNLASASDDARTGPSQQPSGPSPS